MHALLLLQATTAADSSAAGTVALFALYLVATVAIGLWAASRSSGTEEDYFLGGRDSSAFAMALSAVSSGRSAWLVVGASGTAWAMGYGAIWLFPGYILAEALLFVSIGPRLRRRSEEAGAITVPEALQRLGRGPDGEASQGAAVRRVAALLTVAFLIAYVGAQLLAGGKTLGAIFPGYGGGYGLTITATIVLAYTLLGGYRAVVITDVIQALFMLGGIVVVPFLALKRAGGFGEVHAALETAGLASWNPGWIVVVGFLAIGLGSLGNPHILVRHMSLRDPRQAWFAGLTGTVWNVVMAAGSFVMGLVGRAIYPTTASLPGADTESIFAALGQLVATEYLFAAFAGVILAALFAAVMSTCDSQLLVIASSLVRDFGGRRGGEKEGLGASRLMVLVTLVAAAFLGQVASDGLVHNLVLYAWAALGAAFGPPLLMLLYGRRASALGVLLGMLCGVVTVIVWEMQVTAWNAGNFELIPAFAVGLAVTWILSPRAPRSA